MCITNNVVIIYQTMTNKSIPKLRIHKFSTNSQIIHKISIFLWFNNICNIKLKSY
jgi:hypothetical protein